MEVATYSASEVTITFGGYILQNWDKVNIRRTIPSFRQINGIRGKNSRVRTNNTAAEIQIDLPQTSDANYIFQKIVELDEQSGNARLSITIKDSLGSEVFSSDDSFVTGYADREYGSDISGRRWVISCMSSKYNAPESNLSLDSIFNSLF